MARKRFNPAERAIIASGGAIEWQNVTQWHPGLLCGLITTTDGWQSVKVENRARTARLSPGQIIDVSPGHIRAIGG